MSIVRHPLTDDLTFKETVQTLLRCYCTESSLDWASRLSMAEFYYYCSTNQAARYLPFEMIYGFQSSTPADRLLPLVRTSAEAADRFTNIVEIRYVVKQLLILSKERMTARSTQSPPYFTFEILYIFLPVAYIFAPKNANT
jgi:hypothetical protein